MAEPWKMASAIFLLAAEDISAPSTPNIGCTAYFSGSTKDDLLECAAKGNIKNVARIIDEVC